MQATATELTTRFNPPTSTAEQTPRSEIGGEVMPFPARRMRQESVESAWARQAMAANGFGGF